MYEARLRSVWVEPGFVCPPLRVWPHLPTPHRRPKSTSSVTELLQFCKSRRTPQTSFTSGAPQQSPRWRADPEVGPTWAAGYGHRGPFGRLACPYKTKHWILPTPHGECDWLWKARVWAVRNLRTDHWSFLFFAKESSFGSEPYAPFVGHPFPLRGHMRLANTSAPAQSPPAQMSPRTLSSR
jgi:hypothetical protein